MRRVVRSVSSNVALPVLPEARIDMRNEMRSLSARDDGKVGRLRQRKKEATEPQRRGENEMLELKGTEFGLLRLQPVALHSSAKIALTITFR
jgi:hypothetical protein